MFVTFEKRDLEFSKIFNTPVFNISENSDLILVFQCRYVNCFGNGRVLVIIFFHISVSFVCISSLVVLAKRKGGTYQSWAHFHCPLISPLSVDPLINGTALIFHFENVNLTEER